MYKEHTQQNTQNPQQLSWKQSKTLHSKFTYLFSGQIKTVCIIQGFAVSSKQNKQNTYWLRLLADLEKQLIYKC